MLDTNRAVTDTKVCLFDSAQDMAFTHHAPGFDRVLHVFNDAWHGIRAASGYAPGHKLAISEVTGIDAEVVRHVEGLIHRHRIDRVIFQGYSDAAHGLAESLKSRFGDAVRLHAVTHVTATQFENRFEIRMQALLRNALAKGTLTRLGSVKPDFDTVIEEYWPATILNFGPNLGDTMGHLRKARGEVLIPIENSWRKNLYTNMLAALRSDLVSVIHTVNFPTGLETLADVAKISLMPFRKGVPLFAMMASVELQMNLSLAECQPMTQLEALAVGTPCITSPLHLHEFENDPLLKLCEVAELDNPRYVRQRIDEVMTMQLNDPGALREMIEAHMARRTGLATQRYGEFLDL